MLQILKPPHIAEQQLAGQLPSQQAPHLAKSWDDELLGGFLQHHCWRVCQEQVSGLCWRPGLACSAAEAVL